MKKLGAALLWVLIGWPIAAQPDASCVVIYDVEAATYSRSDPAACAARVSPASTFKIPHALIALETGVVTPQTVQKWDGTKYTNRKSWEKAHTLESAIPNSVLWFFQRTAVRIGPERMHKFLETFGYGNTDTSGAPDQYWINGTLQISANEQVEFLKRFYARDLGVAAQHYDTVVRAMGEPAGGVQNATGIHKLASPWGSDVELTAKTGAGMARKDPEIRVSWLVGRLSVKGRHYIFASDIVRHGTVDPVDAARLAFETFRRRKLIE